MVKNDAIKACNNLVHKVKQISNLRSTSHRQKILKIFNYLGEILNGPTDEESATEGKGLKINTKPNA